MGLEQDLEPYIQTDEKNMCVTHWSNFFTFPYIWFVLFFNSLSMSISRWKCWSLLKLSNPPPTCIYASWRSCYPRTKWIPLAIPSLSLKWIWEKWQKLGRFQWLRQCHKRAKFPYWNLFSFYLRFLGFSLFFSPSNVFIANLFLEAVSRFPRMASLFSEAAPFRFMYRSTVNVPFKIESGKRVESFAFCPNEFFQSFLPNEEANLLHWGNGFIFVLGILFCFNGNWNINNHNLLRSEWTGIIFVFNEYLNKPFLIEN